MQVGPYQVEESIASGGQGGVFRAHDVRNGRRVALKLVQIETPRQHRRVTTEVTSLARLDHPHVVRLIEWGNDAGYTWFAQELVEGESLATRLARAGRLSVEEATRVLVSVAQGLQSAHEIGVIHRDIKPDNVMLRADGSPVLIDFGLALDTESAMERMTRTGTILGTPGYWPPEQALGKVGKIGPPSDVYSLGACLYATLAGRPPLTAKSVMAYAQALHEGKIEPLTRLRDDVSDELWALCKTCLALEPEDRLPTAGDFAATLASLSGTRPSTSRGGAIAVAGALLALAVGSAWTLGVIPGAEEAPRRGPVAAQPAPPEPAPDPVQPRRELSTVEVEQQLLEASMKVSDGELEQALAILGPLLEANSELTLGWFARGEAELGLGRTEAALDSFGRALELDPELSKAHYLRGQGQVVLGRFPQALADFSRAIELEPGRADAYARRGTVFANMQSPLEAVEDYSRALELDPKHVAALAGRALTRANAGELAAARRDYDRVLELEPREAVHFARRGAVNLKLQDWARANSDLSHALSLDPQRVDLLGQRAWVRRVLGQHELAIGDLSDALLRGEDLDAEGKRGLHVHRGQALLLLGRDAEAAADFVEVAEFDPYSALGLAVAGGESDWVEHHARRSAQDWNLQLCRAWVGGLSREELLALANADEAQPAGKRCEAELYLGARHQLAGELDQARLRYRACVAEGESTYFEHELAVARLEQLEAK